MILVQLSMSLASHQCMVVRLAVRLVQVMIRPVMVR
jgi:hypothetical protein